ncbi:unnamed protein product [Porites lobata]|uniref:Uncharacterized protein n=1 Tax=Porites lobata TaxID=104759 RepID=A0ABN8Q899_9CNID|nr:unnamed protein product [Porites lobata]
MAQPPDPYGRDLYEILKIWVPTHGVINVYRKPAFRCGEYHVDNGWLFQGPKSNGYGIETLRILPSHGGVIEITRDSSLPAVQNKYTITPANLAVDASTVNVENW